MVGFKDRLERIEASLSPPLSPPRRYRDEGAFQDEARGHRGGAPCTSPMGRCRAEPGGAELGVSVRAGGILPLRCGPAGGCTGGEG
jgi:hypothetical protein